MGLDDQATSTSCRASSATAPACYDVAGGSMRKLQNLGRR